MAKSKTKNKKKKGSNKENKEDKNDSKEKKGALREDTVRAIASVLSFVAGIFFVLAAFDLGGIAGKYSFEFLFKLFGAGYFFIPLVLILIGATLLRSLENAFNKVHALGALLFFISGVSLAGLLTHGDGGGLIGGFIASPLEKFFDFYASFIILSAFMLISIFIMFNTSIRFEHFAALKNRFSRSKKKEDPEADKEKETDEKTAEEFPEVENKDELTSTPETEKEEAEVATEEDKKEGVFAGMTERWKKSSEKKKKEDEMDAQLHSEGIMYEYSPPPTSILKSDSGKPSIGDVKASANIIKRTLSNFGIQVEMDEVSVGPSVTRYALKPAEGVKLSKIVGLQNDLSLALAAHPLRIEAPIPGKSQVGIEIPNKTKSTVGLGTLLEADEFQNSPKSLLTALGKDVSGNMHFANLAKAPHMLIAGATGSGKSVTIHALITSLLYRNSPEYLKFIMVDPKRVELTLYNKIPHLLTPVITNPKDTIKALKWAAKEMDRRYDILEAEATRDIESYHQKVVNPARKKFKETTEENRDPLDLPETMPYIVIIIDELADIMATYPRELEASIVRLAQMSRAVGIHLVLSTQRPSVNVITGLIKANIPARMALQVASQVDSRTILDAGGAERLLGSGDLLYLSGEMSKPKRIQSAFISEEEVKKVSSHIRKHYQGGLDEELDLAISESGPGSDLFEEGDSEDDEDEDELYEEARETVIQAGKASTSFLQRKFKIGYNRGARLMDMLEARGVIGPANGAKPRQILDRPEDHGQQTEEQS
ncbi:MAG: DNA translocase FtsK 4TM domain-containing protein [Candidatus Paceibacterota bacterium]